MRPSPIILLALALAFSASGCAAMMEAWRTEHCNYDGAYADGMNDARGGKPMNVGQYDHCVDGIADAKTGYREGFTNGTATTAIVVHEHRGQRHAGHVAPPAGTRHQPPCRYQTDCASGAWCRDRGDGYNVCMDSEPRGNFCQHGTDCASGLFCRDRGDGFSVCM